MEQPGRNDPCPCGSGSKFKKCHLGAEGSAPRRPKPQAADTTDKRNAKPLLATTTGEPYQPARLYYHVAYKELITTKLQQLRCIEWDGEGDRYAWLYTAEAKHLKFGIPYKELPSELHPVVIGFIRFPEPTVMTLEVRSLDRAIEGARFFARHLGTRAILRNGRIINQVFDASVLGDNPTRGRERIDAMLDQNVVVIDWEERADAVDELASRASSPEEARRLVMEEARRRDVPLVEHFPLHADEEDGDFSDLATTLRLRGVRALERWMGKTDTTIVTVIERMAAEVSKMGTRAPAR